MTFTLRREGDTENPIKVRPFGVQTTAGLLAYYTKKGGQTYYIVLLGEGERIAKGQTSGEGEFDGIEWFRYGGRLLQPYDTATASGDYIFHPGLETDRVLQFSDPVQGRPTFFPELETSFSGIPYVEVRLPQDLSADTGEPTESEIKVRTSRVQNYDANGTPLGKGFTSNVARIAAFAAKYYGGIDIAARFHWPTWVSNFRDRCDVGLGWATGAGDGLTGQYYNGTSFNTLIGTRIDQQIEFNWGNASPMPGIGDQFSVRWTGKFEAKATDTYTFYLDDDDAARVYINSVLVVNDWTTGGAKPEQSGSVVLAAGKHDITVEYRDDGGAARVFLWYSTPTISRRIVPKELFYSSNSIATTGRIIPRFEGDIVLTGVPWPQAWQAIMDRAPGVKWQIVNGKVKFIYGPERTVVKRFTYDPTQNTVLSNIVKDSVSIQRLPPSRKPNFFIVGYRDKDTDTFEQRYIDVKRTELRSQNNGRLVDLGIFQIGVATQSLAQRIGETQMRFLADRDTEVELKGLKDSHEIAKHDLIEIAHKLGDWKETPLAGETGPVTFEILKETFESTISTANEKTFIARIWRNGDYSDTDQGPLITNNPGDIISRFTPAPKITSLTLIEKVASLPDGTPSISIDGLAQFDASFPFSQFGRIWWRRPNEEKVFNTDFSTDTLTVTGHGYTDGIPVMVRNTGGSLPTGLTDTTIYFVIRLNSDTIKLSATAGGAPIDLTANGSGINRIGAFIVNDHPLEPNTVNKQAAFSLPNAEMGIHKILVIPESYTQQRLPLSVHDIYSITVATPTPSVLKVFDTVPPKDNLASALGLTIAVGKSASGSWYGAVLYRDRGYGYESVASLTRQSFTGTTVAPFLTTNGDQVDILMSPDTNPPSNATLVEVTAGKNNWLIGREIVGVRTWTSLGGNVYRGTDLVRGLRLTDHLQNTHTAAEDAALNDDTVVFIPMELRDLDQSISFKLVTVGLQLSDVAAKTIVFNGNSVVVHPPFFFTASFDPANGNCLLDWFPGEDRVGLESYELELRNGPGSGSATVRGPLTITPIELARVSSTPPLKAVIETELDLPLTAYQYVGPGGFDANFTQTEWNSGNKTARVICEAPISLNAGMMLEMEVGGDPLAGVYFPDSAGIRRADNNNFAAGWRKYVDIVVPENTEPDTVVPLFDEQHIYRVRGGERLTFVVQPDGTVAYYVNYMGAVSNPWYVSPLKLDLNIQYKLMFFVIGYLDTPFSSPVVKIRNVRWLRNTPEFVYTGEMQKSDLGVNDLPVTVYGRVRQKSFFPGGKASDWNYGSFPRS